MVIMDFGHLSHRLLYTAIFHLKLKPDKVTKKIRTKDYEDFFRHLLFNNLKYIFSSKFNEWNDEIVIACDAKNNWRKDFFNEYKAHRSGDREKSDIEFSEFYALLDEVLGALKTSFPVKVVYVEKAEADDICGVLAKELSKKRKVLVVSSDKDYKQILEYDNVALFDPIKKEFIKMTKQEVKEFKLFHTILGDSGDNIPNIKVDSEFHKDFLNFLRSEQIFITEVDKFQKLQISEMLIEKYKTEHPDSPIYKKAMFGEVAAKKFMDDFENNFNTLSEVCKKNFARNQVLVDFNFIPEEISKAIIEAYFKAEAHYDSNAMMNYFLSHNLNEMFENLSSFYISPVKNDTLLPLNDF